MKWFSVIFVGLLLLGCQPFQAESDALLSETGAKYQVLSREGGIRERKMYCDLKLAPAEVAKLVQALGLSEPNSNGSAPTRILYLSGGEGISSPALEKMVNDAFGRQLWIPSRHGFAGAFLIYDSKSGIGRLWLSIASG